MKKLAISITFLVLLLPLIIIGVLDYKLSEYGVSYKNRVINLKKSSIEFHNMVFKKDDYMLKSPVVVVKFDLLKPSMLNISANSMTETKNKISAKNINLDVKDFYKTFRVTVKSLNFKNYGIKLSDFDVTKKFSDLNGTFRLASSLDILKLCDRDKNRVAYDIFFKETSLISVKNPFKFSIEVSEFPVYKISTNDVKFGNVDFERVKLSVIKLKDSTYRTKAVFNLNKKSDFKINGTVIKFQPLNAKFKMLLNNVGLFDAVLGRQYKKNKIYSTVSKFFNINIDNIIRVFDFCIEDGKLKINL